jgi:UDP-glucose 4-epimerase
VIDGENLHVRGVAGLVAQAKSIYHLAAAVGVDLVVKSPIHVLATNLHETEVLLEAAAPHPGADPGGIHLGSLRQKREGGVQRRRRSAHRPAASFALGLRMLEVDGRIPRARLRQGIRELPVVIARMFNTVGPRQTGRYGMVLPRFIAAARRNEPLKVFGDGQQSRCFCFVLDTVEALVRLQNTPAARGQIFNIGNTEEVTILELAQRVIETLGSKSTIELLPYEKAYAPGFDDMRRRKPWWKSWNARLGSDRTTSLQEIIQRTAVSL